MEKTYEIADYGVDHCQYFPGVSTVFTGWQHVELGAGETPQEALQDAIDQIAMGDTGFDVEQITEELSNESDIPEADDDDLGEFFHYVAVFYTVDECRNMEHCSMS